MNYEDLMKRAISLADQYKYTAKPNPVVGCIIVKNKTIISEGAHKEFGSHHAEVNAIEEAKKLQEEGHFQQGSMWPKIRSAIHFLKHHGKKAVITNIANIQKAIEGKAGTTIIKE